MKPVVAISRAVFLVAAFLAACTGCDRVNKDVTSDAGISPGVATGPDRPKDKSGPASAASTGIPGYGTSGTSEGNPGASASGGDEPIWTTGSSATATSGAFASSSIDDGIVSAKVKTALLGDADIKGTDIKVETRNGEVLLSGFVKDKTQIDKAVQLAGRVEGVRSVNNKMVLKQ